MVQENIERISSQPGKQRKQAVRRRAVQQRPKAAPGKKEEQDGKGIDRYGDPRRIHAKQPAGQPFVQGEPVR